jgi:hypothetical protein
MPKKTKKANKPTAPKTKEPAAAPTVDNPKKTSAMIFPGRSW